MIPVHLVARALSVLVLLAHTAGVVCAQDTVVINAVEVIIEERQPNTTVRGIVLRMTAEAITALVGTEAREIPLANVSTIKARGDSVRNGAIIGALVGGIGCLLVCGQGLDRASQLPMAMAVNGGILAVAGAGIDAAIPGYRTIYRHPATTAAARPKRPTLSIRWRF